MKIRFSTLLKILLLLVVLHNIEEALTMPDWISQHSQKIVQQLNIHIQLNFSPLQFYFSLVFATIIPILVVVFCSNFVKKSKKIHIIILTQSILFLNSIIPHLLAVIMLFGYFPGAITSIVLTIPFSIYFFYKAIEEELVDKSYLAYLFLFSTPLYLILIFAINKTGYLIVNYFN